MCSATPARVSRPDWKYALFSLVLALPADAAPDAGEGEFIRIEEHEGGWSRGRFAGIARADLPDSGRGGGPAPNLDHHSAFGRYPATLAEAIGGCEIDIAKKDRERLPYSERFRFQHIEFSPSDDLWAFSLRDDEGHPEASVGLRAAEVLQYRDHRPAASGEPAVARFLVLHIHARDCSGAMLRRIAQSVHRLRNMVPLRDSEERPLPSVHRDRRKDSAPHERSLVQFLLEQLRRRGLRCDEARDPLSLQVSNGGFLEGVASVGCRTEHCGTCDSLAGRAPSGAEEAVPAGQALRLGAGARRRSTIPQHVAIAIPGRDDVAAPPGAGPEEHSRPSAVREVRWTSQEIWAWMLASGADDRAENHPNLHEEPEQAGLIGRARGWSVFTAPEGLALVRHGAELQEGLRPLALAATRYVDLVILNLRAYSAMAELAAQLGDERSLPEAHSGGRELDARLERLRDIENGFVEMRDRLWFQSIPKHPLDADVMRELRSVLGLNAQYRDFLDELNTRRDIYRTQHGIETLRQQTESLAAQERSLEAQGDILRAQQKMAQAETDKADRESRLQLWIGLFALALGWPTLVDLFVERHGWTAGFVGASVPLLVAVVFLIRRPWQNEKNARESENER